MKERSGFVSNSSTSSFVFRGFDYTEEFNKLLTDDDKEAFIDDLGDENIQFLYGEYTDYGSGWTGDTPRGVSLVIGECLTTFSDENYTDPRLMEEADGIEERVEALSAKFNAASSVRWWEGVRSS